MKTNDLNELIERLIKNSFEQGFIDGWNCRNSDRNIKYYDPYMQNYYLNYVKYLKIDYSIRTIRREQ